MIKEYKIIDNFLEKDFFTKIKSTLTGDSFSWYFNSSMTATFSKDSYFFYHLFFYNNQVFSNYYSEFIIPIINKIKIKALINARANLMVNKNTVYESDYHTDFDYPHTSAIYYVNNNNGFTMFEKSKVKIECVENRLLIFNSTIKHKAVSQTNENQRIVINLNFFE